MPDVVERPTKPCSFCGEREFKVEPGKGPHAFHLRCTACDRGGMWIGKKEARRLGLEAPANVA